MPGANGNKRRRLAASENVQHELAVSESLQHSRVVYSSDVLTASTSHAIDETSMAIPSSCISSGKLSSQMLPSGRDNLSEVSYSVYAGKNKMSLMTDIIDDKSSDKMVKCYTINDEHLLGAINYKSSYEAVVLLNKQENSFTQDGLNKALISACRRGHKVLVQTLVRVGANIEHRDENGNMPLVICAVQGFTDIVRFLVFRHANVNARNSTGNTALILSVRPAGSMDLTRFLLEQQDVDIHHENQDGDTALNRATQFKDVDTMRLLLKKSLARASDRGDREVHVITHETDKCFFNSRAQEIKQEVIAAKAGLKDVYDILKEHVITGTSLLKLAIKARDRKSLEIFLDCQWPSSSDKKYSIDSALMYMFPNSRHAAVQRFSATEVKIIQMLLQYGADVNQGSAGTKLICLVVESGDFQLVELMCTHGAELNMYFSYGELGPLCVAAKIGRQDLIQLLLKYGADLNKYVFFEKPLDHALRNDHTECAKLLIQRGAKMDVARALKSAVEHQRPNYMHFVFENYNHEFMDFFSQKTFDARHLLILAVKKGNSDIIGQILDAGVDVNEEDWHWQTPLMVAKNKAVVEFLIQRGADVNQLIYFRKSKPETYLSYLIKNRKCVDASTVELCKVLIDNGAMVNFKNGEGKTPLMMAASQADCVSMLKMLLDNGADVTDKDTKGNTALLHAITNGYSKNASCLLNFSRNLKSAINIPNNEGLTPLIISVMKPNLVIMKKLIEEGADVNIKDNNENAALHHLMLLAGSRLNLKSSKDILTSLLKVGSHVNCQNSEGLSPLMLAAKKSKPSLMSILLDAGADVTAVCKNNHSQTAISFLSETTNLENDNILCIELLLERGASASHLSHECLHELIFQDKLEVIPKLIQHGLGPADIEASQMHLQISSFGLPRTLSPLCAALLRGHISLARHFMDILFLTRSDLSVFASNKAMECLLIQLGQRESRNFLQELSSQPMSLDNLSLVTVSAAVGSSLGRETRVDSLPLPQMMKDRLLFKSIDDKHHALSEMHPEHKTTGNKALLAEDDDDEDGYEDDDDFNVYAANYSDSDDAT